MSFHRFINLALAGVICAVMSLSYLLDGPSELDAAKATADSVSDARKAARAQYMAEAKRHSQISGVSK